jgi:hypothetical protein
MLTLIRDGGYAVFFILAFGFVALGSAVRFAISKPPRPLGFCYGMAAATLFATLHGLCSDLGTVFLTMTRHDPIPDDPERYQHIVEGLGESMSPGIIGFALLATIALVVAVGKGRAEKAAP